MDSQHANAHDRNAPERLRHNGRSRSPAQYRESQAVKREYSEDSNDFQTQIDDRRTTRSGDVREMGIENENSMKRPKPDLESIERQKYNWKNNLGLRLGSSSRLPLTPGDLVTCQDLASEFDSIKKLMMEKKKKLKDLTTELSELETELMRGTSKMKSISDKHHAITGKAKKLRSRQQRRADKELLKTAAELRARERRPREVVVSGEEEGEISVKQEGL